MCPGAQRARKKSYFYLGFLTLGNSSLQRQDVIMFDYPPCSVLSSLCVAAAGSPTINGFNSKGVVLDISPIFSITVDSLKLYMKMCILLPWETMNVL